MKYYKVKAEKDGVRRVLINKTGAVVYAGEYVANELYTGREISRFTGWKNIVEPVEISRNRVYWFFGARFAD